MVWAFRINLVVLTLLSIMTGVVKLVQMQEEMVIFEQAGFPTAGTIAFGVVQLVGGLLLIAPKTRRVGAVVMALTFVVATSVLFINALIPFGIFSLSFIASAAAVAAWPSGPQAPSQAAAT